VETVLEKFMECMEVFEADECLSTEVPVSFCRLTTLVSWKLVPVVIYYLIVLRVLVIALDGCPRLCDPSGSLAHFAYVRLSLRSWFDLEWRDRAHPWIRLLDCDSYRAWSRRSISIR